jgi:hypothetical protein
MWGCSHNKGDHHAIQVRRIIPCAHIRSPKMDQLFSLGIVFCTKFDLAFGENVVSLRSTFSSGSVGITAHGFAPAALQI